MQIMQKLQGLAMKHYQDSKGKSDFWGDILHYKLSYDGESLTLKI